MADYYVREEDGTSRYIIEDGSGDYLLETSVADVTPSFIASVTTVHAPTLEYTSDEVFSAAGTYSWLCPPGITLVAVDAYGGGGAGGNYQGNGGAGGGGGGAYARRLIPVTPGNTYTVTVGAGGTFTSGAGNPGGDSSFTGDSSVQVLAKGGGGGDHDPPPGAGGSAASSVGDIKFSGGSGGTGQASPSSNGAGGGASGNILAAGAVGGNSSSNAGGVGANGGGSGGHGGTHNANDAQAGFSPGGGGGGGGAFNNGNSGADGQIRITLDVAAPFIASATTLYGPTLAYTDQFAITTPGTYSWLCPTGVTAVYVQAYGGGGGGGWGQHLSLPFDNGGGGGGGGAYAARIAVPVTPGTLYTFVVGAGGAGGNQNVTSVDGSDSTFTGDSGVQVVAKGGHRGIASNKGTGGAAGSSTGDTVASGGDGGQGSFASNGGGAGGGASGSSAGAGANGTDSLIGSASGQPGGAGVSSGGSGGNGGNSGGTGFNGSVPGGGGGAGAWDVTFPGQGGNGGNGEVSLTPAFVVPFISSVTTVYTPTVIAATINAPFISSVTVVYTPSLDVVYPPFISSVTVVYAPELPEVNVPFISSQTHVWRIFSLFDPNKTYGGPGNGGEAYAVRLNANGVTNTATLAADINTSSTTLNLAGDSAFPTDAPFVVMIDSEEMLIFQISLGNYHVRLRGIGNTTRASHSAGASVSWGDSYDMGIAASFDIASSFTADINLTGSSTYYGWLMAFDSTQAYLTDGTRYPLHVTEFVGVFDSGAGTSGTNRVDGSQPSAIHAPEAASDHCGAALTVPALITSDITVGDVAVVRYTNPEAVELDLGPRSVGVQSWFGLKRVDTSDNDVTLTNPNGIVVDTKSGYATYTGSANTEPDEPLALATGIAKDASAAAGHAVPTPNPVPWLTVTLPGSDRYFTDGIHYSEKGWPIGVLSVRQGDRRIPYWESWDWHNFSYVYNGFGTDDSFAQIVINRNGMTGTLPTLALPGAQDIDGPDAYWDDGTYFFGASWYVVLVATPYLVVGPVIGGVGPGASGFPVDTVPTPVVTFPGGPGSPVISGPTIEGGSGGGIGQEISGLHIWQRSGGFF